jgi:hypothetical protein
MVLLFLCTLFLFIFLIIPLFKVRSHFKYVVEPGLKPNSQTWFCLVSKLRFVMVHICKPNSPKAEAGGLQVQGQPGVHCETLCQQQQQKNPPKLMFLPLR